MTFFEKILQNAKLMKSYMSFFLTFISVVGVLALAWFKGTDIEFLLPTILGLFISGKMIERTAAIMTAGKDEKADTRQVIKDLDDTAQ